MALTCLKYTYHENLAFPLFAPLHLFTVKICHFLKILGYFLSLSLKTGACKQNFKSQIITDYVCSTIYAILNFEDHFRISGT